MNPSAAPLTSNYDQDPVQQLADIDKRYKQLVVLGNKAAEKLKSDIEKGAKRSKSRKSGGQR
jgi:hypothetical protein